MSDINDIKKQLNELGIDTSKMSEEDIKKLAESINNMMNNNSGLSQEEIQRKISNLVNNPTIINNPALSPLNRMNHNNMVTPQQIQPGGNNASLLNNNGLNNANHKPIHGISNPSNQKPQNYGNNLGGQKPLNYGGNNNKPNVPNNISNLGKPSSPNDPNMNNRNMNYTDDNKNPRDSKPRTPNKGQNQVNNPAVNNQSNVPDNSSSSSTRPANDDFAKKDGVDSEKNKSEAAKNQAQGANVDSNSLNQFANPEMSADSVLAASEMANNDAPFDRNLQNREFIKRMSANKADLSGPNIDENGNFNIAVPYEKTVVTPQQEQANNSDNKGKQQQNPKPVPAASASSTTNDKKNKKGQPANKNEQINKGKNNNKNERAKTRNAVADNKIDRAKRRLRQNGVGGNEENPNRRRPPIIPAALPIDEGEESSNTSSNPAPGRMPGLSPLSKLRARLKGLAKRNREVDEDYNEPEGLEGGIKDKISKEIKNKVKLWVISHLPIILAVLGIVLLLFVVIIVITAIITMLPDVFGIGEKSNDVQASSANTTCTYSASGNSGLNEIKNTKIELINCDATSSNYKVIDTIDLEKYSLGVALAEIGPDSPDEGIKAQIVAARTVALSRNKSMCPNDPDNCFYGYNKSANAIRMRACENDQVYWDYTKDIYRQDRGAVSLYSPEINSGSVWKSALSSERRQQVEALANAVKGEVLLDSNGDIMEVGYKSSDQVQMLDEAKKGKNYKEILEAKYGVSPTKGDNKCETGSIDYGNYQLNTDNSSILHEPLSSFLQSKGTSLEAFNQLIQSNVQKAGYGTRAGVVAAAVTLIGELSNQYNVKVPYFWGGGHEKTYESASGNWGSSSCHTYANDQDYNYCGLDCSGFVGWAIYNGGFRNVTTEAKVYVNLEGANHVDLTSSAALQPGDLLYSSGHVILIIGIDQASGQYICAEAAGNTSGVIFSRHSFNDGDYSGVDMTGFYENNKRG